MTPDDALRQEALTWFKSTNTTPERKISEDQIVEIYKKLKTYAESDPLLEDFYQANHMHL